MYAVGRYKKQNYRINFRLKVISDSAIENLNPSTIEDDAETTDDIELSEVITTPVDSISNSSDTDKEAWRKSNNSVTNEADGNVALSASNSKGHEGKSEVSLILLSLRILIIRQLK